MTQHSNNIGSVSRVALKVFIDKVFRNNQVRINHVNVEIFSCWVQEKLCTSVLESDTKVDFLPALVPLPREPGILDTTCT